MDRRPEDLIQLKGTKAEPLVVERNGAQGRGVILDLTGRENLTTGEVLDTYVAAFDEAIELAVELHVAGLLAFGPAWTDTLDTKLEEAVAKALTEGSRPAKDLKDAVGDELERRRKART